MAKAMRSLPTTCAAAAAPPLRLSGRRAAQACAAAALPPGLASEREKNIGQASPPPLAPGDVGFFFPASPSPICAIDALGEKPTLFRRP